MKNKLLYQKRLLQFACSLCLILLCITASWGQAQVIGTFPFMQGGFENQTAGTVGTTLSTTAWTRSSTAGTSAIVTSAANARTGTKYANGVFAALNQRALQSSSGTATTTAVTYTIQFYVKNASLASFQVGLNTTNVTATIPTSSSWTKVTQAILAPVVTAGSLNAYIGRASANTTSFDVDDVVVYLGAADATLPDNPTTPVASAIGDNQQTISWTAASGSEGVDGGGYIVVRGTAAIASTPNANGIYGVGNTVATGEQVVYIGTGTTFTDTGLNSSTAYFYKIYSVDKAFNYGATPITITSTTTGAVVPVITASTAALSGFLTTTASASATQSFTVTGVTLTNNLVVSTASTDYELSSDGFATAGVASINLGLTPTNPTTISVRLKSGLIGGAKTANITVASTGAAAVSDVVCTGGVSATYYYVGSGALTTNTNWGTNTDGTGTNPTAVTDAFATFIIRNTTAVSTDAAWVLGASSKLIVGDATLPAVALTVVSTFPITGGPIDIPAASSGANSLFWQDVASPIYGTLHASSEVHLQPAIAATYTIAGPTFGKLFIDGAGVVTISSSATIASSLFVAANSTFSLNYGAASALPILTGGTATINGTLRCSRGSGSGLFSFSGATTAAIRFADAITTPSILTLGSSNTIDYNNGTTTQIVSVLPAGVNYNNLIISGASTKTVAGAVAVTGKLTVSAGSLTTGGFITLKSTATKTAVVAPVVGTITGNVIVERYIPAGSRQYRLLSPATTGGTINANWQEAQADGVDGNVGFGTHITGAGAAANGFDTTTNNAASLFTHTNTGAPAAWTAVANTNVNTLTAGSPYLIYLRGSRLATNKNGSLTNDATTLRTTGTLATGTQVVSGLNTTANGFSLIGNPYQAQVDMQAVLSTSTDLVQGFYYVLNPANGAYSTFDFGLNTGTSGNANKYLQPGQACFVKTVAAPTAPALSFTEANKSEALAQTAVFRTKQLANMLRLSLYDTTKPADAVDGLIVAFDDSENNAVNDNDAAKLTNFNENMATSNSGKLLSIEKRAIPTATDEILLNITKYKGTSYSLKVQGSGLTETPFLVDAFTGTNTEIPQDGTVDYAYTVDAGNPDTTSADRFKLIYSTTLKNIDNAVSGFVLYPNPSQSNSFNVMVPQSMSRASLTVSNLLGQKLYSQNDLQSGATVRVNVRNVNSAGVYLVSLTSEGKTTTTKWIVE